MSGAFISAALIKIAWAVAAAAVSYGIQVALAPTPPDISNQGPRLNDLKAQTSAYGAAVTIAYGAMRMAGNMIWAKPILETSHVTVQGGGGKGKGGPSATSTTYTYSQSFAIGLCEGTILGVLKIWANGKLIYHLANTADVQTLIASQQQAAGIRFYTGSEIQTADPLIQADIGIANTPAYRGLAYVLFENLQLEDFFNRTPNLEFEVLVSATSTGVFRRLLVVNPTKIQFSNGNHFGSGVEGVGVPAILSANGILRVTSINFNNVYLFDLNGKYIGQDTRKEGEAYPAQINSTYPTPVGLLKGLPVAIKNFSVATRSGSTIMAYPYSSGINYNLNLDLTRNLPGGEYVHAATLSADGQRIIIFTGPTSGANDTIDKWYLLDSGAIIQSQGTMATSLNYVALGFGNSASARTDLDVANYICSNLENDYTNLWTAFGAGSGPVVLYTIINAVFTETGRLQNGGGLPYTDTQQPSIYCNNGIAWLIAGTSSAVFTRLTTLAKATTALSGIVSNLCVRAGMSTGDINVAALTDAVDGYAITKQGSARAGIEPLMSAYYFDAIESDSKIKFVKRGGSIAAVIPDGDLAAHQYGSQVPDQLPISRTQELELPIEMAIQYMDKDADYQTGVQYARRLTSSSKQKNSFQASIALPASKAKQIVDVLLYDAWTVRTIFTLAISNKYSYLEPTDVVQITKAGRTYTARLTDKDEASGIHSYSAVLEDLQVYSQNAVAASIPVPVSTVSLIGPTNLQLLDIPLLRDQDDGVGFYAAASGYIAGWRGAQLFKSTDGGGSWFSSGNAFLAASTMGFADGVLATLLSGNIFDETNTVSVILGSGTLSSTTELAVLNGANAAVLGSEIIQFKNAVLTATNTYTLSGLLRGRQGTEWAMTTHVSGERFVFLTTGTTYIEQAVSSEVGLLRKYRAVTFGSNLVDALSTDFTHNSVAQECYSPVLLGGGRDASGNITLNWTRRTRIGGAWLNNVDASLGEASENYTIRIWSSNTYLTLKRTLTSTTQTVAYSAANQVTDFGGNQAVIWFDVAQVSNVVGDGYFQRGSG